MTEPALTPEQWAMRPKVEFRPKPYKYATDGDGIELDPTGTLTVYNDSWAASVQPSERHALAALALHGQPFGFTWEDVWNLQNVGVLEIRHIADKIAALLPPES